MLMEERKIKCTIITPMFSYGAYQTKYPEVRVSELKGMIRYVYRIICPTPCKLLVKDEAELFGGAAGNEASDAGHASPVRLLVRNNGIEKKSEQLLLHKNKDRRISLSAGSFEILVRLNPYVSKRMQKQFPAVNLNWYTEFIELTLMLVGLGKRSRKGRGSVAVDDRVFDTKEEILSWICCTLNKVTQISSNPRNGIYTVVKGEISSNYNSHSIKRPLIQKIRTGIKLTQEQVNGYLWAVDQIGHETKEKMKNTPYQPMATGSISPRLASPLIISLIQTREGIYPIYVFVKAICKDREIDFDGKERELFIQNVERKMKGGVKK